MTASNVLAQSVPVVSLPTATAAPSPQAPANAQTQQLGERLERLESLVNQIQEQNRLLMQQNHELTQRLAGNTPTSSPPPQMPPPSTQSNAPRSNVTNALFPQSSPAMPGRESGDLLPQSLTVDPNTPMPMAMAPAAISESASFQPMLSGSRFLIGGYDDKKHCFALVRPVDPMRTPFELNVSLNTEIRTPALPRRRIPGPIAPARSCPSGT